MDIVGYVIGFIVMYDFDMIGLVIGFLVEYDVLFGFGYVCGYNIIGIVSVFVVVVLKEVVDEIGGKVVVLGCFVEEGGENGFVKVFYVKVGVIDEIDVVLMIYFGNEIYCIINILVVDVLDIKFYGCSVYVFENVDEVLNVLDVMILYFNGIV